MADRAVNDAHWDRWAEQREAMDWAAAGEHLDIEEVRRQYGHRSYSLRHLRNMKSPAVGYAVLDTVAALCAEVERLRNGREGQ